MDTHKRTRSRSSSISSNSSSGSFNQAKLQRPSSPPLSTFTCTLPPSCSLTPQHFPSSESLSSHYSTYHLHTCLQPPPTYSFAQSKHPRERDKDKCARIFPDERMLELHLKECHDPLTHSLQLSGIKTFSCFSPSCSRLFSTPKTRRLHLIAEHEYPKEYFFGVVVWGIGEVLKKGGSGMIRREWRARPGRNVRSTEETERDDDDVEGFKEPSPAVEEELERERTDTKEDREMDELIGKLEGSSIGFVPRSVARKNGKGTNAKGASIAGTTGTGMKMSIEQDSKS